MAPFGTQEGDDMWLNIEDHPGIVMATIVWILIFYCDFVIIFIAIEYHWWGYWVIGLYNFFMIMSLWSHTKTMITDPGAVSKDAFALAITRDADTVCGRCDAYKPPFSHHCRICGRCIVRMDHHCPWMNNCIGALNQKYFVLFLIYSFAQTVTSISVISVRLATCSGGTPEDCFPNEGGKLIIALLVFTVFALLFLSSMLYNQVYAVRTGIGTIDRMKRRKNESARSTKYKPIRWVDVFGNGSYLFWPIPVEPIFHNIDLVVGYSTRDGESLLRTTSVARHGSTARGGGSIARDMRGVSSARAATIAARGVSRARAASQDEVISPITNPV